MLNEKLHNELAAFLKENYHEFDEDFVTKVEQN